MKNTSFRCLVVVATVLSLGACESPFLNRFPAEFEPVEALDKSVRFTAQQSRLHQLQLVLNRADLPFPTLVCLAGDTGVYACSEGEHPIEVEWEVRTYPDGKFVASGTSILGKNLVSYANDWVARYITAFTGTQGTTYEVRAQVAPLTPAARRTMPKIIVRISTPSAW
jgi:hypothetical protein